MTIRPHLDILAQDLRYAARGFVRSPTFTVAAVFAIALGTGAGTAVFSVVDRILFRSLPYPQADRLVSMGFVAPIIPQEFMLGTDYVEWRSRQQPFESLTSWAGINDCDLTGSSPVRLACALVEASFLPTLGIHPIAGRNFTRNEDRPNAPPVALLSYGLWQSRFGGDRNVVGKTIPGWAVRHHPGRPAAAIRVAHAGACRRAAAAGHGRSGPAPAEHWPRAVVDCALEARSGAGASRGRTAAPL
jgi:hypothetical protein